MSNHEIDLNPVTHITVDAIGKPGQRVFYIQGIKDREVITLILEKMQVQSMALGIEEFLSEIATRFPNLTEANTDYDEDDMIIVPPVDPLFRVGDLGLAYDTEKDLVVLVIREFISQDMDEEDQRVVRFWCTRSQARIIAHWGIEIASRGRPICPQCGEPMEPEGHFCPKKNGHKRG